MANILITGVTSGIGYALMQEFCNLGHTVIGCGRNKEKIAEIKHDFANLSCSINEVDVRNSSAVKQWAKHVLDIYPQIDIIINNAGTKTQLLPLWEVSEEDFINTVNTNLVGVANIIREFVPSQIKHAKCTIVNISSDWGKTADAYVGAYCATKFAIEGLTASLAKELPDGLIAVAISPFIVYTPLLEKCKNLLTQDEYNLGVPPNKWAKFSAPKILDLTSKDNGTSITLMPEK